MSFLYSAVVLVLVLVSLTAVLVLFVEVVTALMPRPRPRVISGVERPRIAVLIPAHDEAATIRDTLTSVQQQLAQGDRLLVVADNCTDETDLVALRLGAEVLVRRDDGKRGKGFALDYGVQHLAADPPELLMIVDADCQLQEGAVDRAAALAAASGRPVQALYLMKQPPNSDVKKQVAEFAWVVKDWVRPLGMKRLGLPCHLTGTGMMFPWSVIHSANLATANLVEDLKLGIELARMGKGPLFCPEAVVTSTFPSETEAQESQRRRWEHGHLGIILSEVPTTLRAAFAQRDPQLLFLALDVAVPPLSLLALLLLMGFVLSAFGAIAGAALAPLYLAVLALVLYALAVLLAWLGFGRGILPLSVLASVPIYILSKVPMYLRFFYNRERSWVRTARDRKAP